MKVPYFEEDVRHFACRVVPGLDLHRRVPAKGAVPEDNVGDVAMATVAVGDGADRGAVTVGEGHVLDKDPLPEGLKWP